MQLNTLRQGLDQKLELLNEKIQQGTFIGYDKSAHVTSILNVVKNGVKLNMNNLVNRNFNVQNTSIR
jgi:hypothetical protein